METENIWMRVKNWAGEHKKAIVIGTTAVAAGVVGLFLIGKSANEHEEDQDIVDTVETQEWDGSGDRFITDTETMNKLPSGTYDVFDMYENERVEFIVE